MSQTMIAEASKSEQSSSSFSETTQRLDAVLEAPIDFIPHADFAKEFESGQNRPAIRLEQQSGDLAPADLPAHLRRMCEAELLSAEREAALFREMNFVKYRASRLRAELRRDAVNESLLTTVEELLRRAAALRDHLIQANMRLVMSIVKKFVTPQLSFDEMLSDGIVTLMQTVEKFDFDRGFRFSTYAYRSIARNAYRAVAVAQKEEARMTRDADEWAFEQEAGDNASSLSEQVWGNLRELAAGMLQQLDRRERFIIRGRYALGAHRKVRTFQCLADKLGVSKDRARQLEQRAVGKLRKLASQFDMDDLFAAGMV